MLPGDLVVSEIMARPLGEDRSEREWFEVYNASSHPLTLDRLVVEIAGSSHTNRHDVTGLGQLPAHTYLVLGSGEPEHGPVDYSYGGGMALTDAGAAIRLSCRGTLVDEVGYGERGSAPPPVQGVSLALDGSTGPDALLNDESDRWCFTAAVGSEAAQGLLYDGVNAGTPGAPNGTCGMHACEDTAQGDLRPIEAPGPGDLRLNSVMANPQGADANREWLEISVTGSTAVDVNGLQIVNTKEREDGSPVSRSWQVRSRSCLSFAPGSSLVVGFVEAEGGTSQAERSIDLVVSGPGIFNDAGRLELVYAGQLIDAATLTDPAEGTMISFGGDSDACQDAAQGSFRPINGPGPGDLRLNAVMADPRGDDTNREWIEIRVVRDTVVDVNDLQIINTKEGTDGSPTSRSWRVLSRSCLSFSPGSFFVVGFVEADGVSPQAERPADLVVSGPGIFNDAGRLELLYAGQLIDAATLTDPAEGEVVSLGDGSLTCLDGGRVRGAEGPTVGGLVVTEVFANPDGADANREWIELFVAEARAVDLNGLEIVNTVVQTDGSEGRHVWSLDMAACTTVHPGTYPVIGFVTQADASLQDGPDVTAVAVGSSLYNGASTLELRYGGELIDFASLPTADSGVANTVDGDNVRDAQKNDRAEDFCRAQSKGGFGVGDEAGTPGAANDSCAAMCTDAGVPRRVVAPEAGDLVITEVFADPSGADNRRDWIELYAGGDEPVDLSGLTLINIMVETGSERRWTVSPEVCSTLPPGTYGVIAGAGAADDGVAAIASLDGGASSLLFNDEADLFLVRDLAGARTLIDAMRYPAPTSGASHALHHTIRDAQSNDFPQSWCTSTTGSTGFSGLGSPGADNAPCF